MRMAYPLHVQHYVMNCATLVTTTIIIITASTAAVIITIFTDYQKNYWIISQ